MGQNAVLTKGSGVCGEDCSHHTVGRRRRATPAAREREDGGAEGAPLGIYAGSSSAPTKGPVLQWALSDDDTGEIVPFERRGNEWVEHKTPQQVRAERYRLKAIVNAFLPGSRTCKCHRWRVPKQSLQVLNSVEFKKAFYAGLQVCASPWLCPLCAPKISERRRVELKGGIERAKKLGWEVMLLTATVPHGLGDDLLTMLDQMLEAWAKTSSTRAGAKARQSIGLEGTIRVLEVTHGQNGWHPHFHVLLFVSGGMTLQQVADIFRPLWQDACKKVGLPRPSDEHGLRVDGGEKAASYASKWGLEHEMTKGHLKRSRSVKGQTPWDLLRCYQDSKCQRSRLLWLTYAEAFKGRRQLCWSRGLKKCLEVVDLSDDEIAAQQDEPASLLAELTDDQWRDVLATKNESALLDLAEHHPEEIDAFLQGVAVTARAKSGKRPAIYDQES